MDGEVCNLSAAFTLDGDADRCIELFLFKLLKSGAPAL